MTEELKKFEDREQWNKKIEEYVDGNINGFGEQVDIWQYFKHCLKTQNRFFFKNPLVPEIIKKFDTNTFVLRADTELYRARIDKDHKFYKQCELAQERIELLNEQAFLL